MKARIINNTLVKQGSQVQKYWKHNGYAVAKEHLEKVEGVKLYTQYDGIIYAPKESFYQHGIDNTYQGEEQLVLPVDKWEVL
jgi:hypothetical protein